MTRKEFENLVYESFGILADYPFEDDLVTGVFRHTGTGKWFALAMNIPASRLGKEDFQKIDVVNLKCAPEVIDSLVGCEAVVYRAYHMNKNHWLTLSLSECDAETVSWLLEASYDLTKSKIIKNRRKE